MQPANRAEPVILSRLAGAALAAAHHAMDQLRREGRPLNDVVAPDAWLRHSKLDLARQLATENATAACSVINSYDLITDLHGRAEVRARTRARTRPRRR